MPLADIAVHTVHLGKCTGLVDPSLVLEVPQKTLFSCLLFLQDKSELHLRSKRR